MTLDSRIIVNLKVISKLNVGEKLSYSNGYFSIASDKTLASKMLRWVVGDSRASTIDAIESLSTICLTHNLLTQQELEHLVRQLQCAMVGITNLMMTYQNDSTVVSRLEFIHDRINEFVSRFPFRSMDMGGSIEEVTDVPIQQQSYDGLN